MRCTDWYANGKKATIEGDSPLYMSNPFVFEGADGTDNLGVRITSPLNDPVNNVTVGQTVVDFSPQQILQAVSRGGTINGPGGFSILITASSHDDGKDRTDTVVAPDFDVRGPGMAIEDILFANDDPCEHIFEYSPTCQQRNDFHLILSEMQNGATGRRDFDRTSLHDRGKTETLNIAYAPVQVTPMLPVNPSDFSSGVRQQAPITLFSYGILQTEQGLRDSFESVHDAIFRTLARALGALCAIIVCSVLIVVYISAQVTTSITIPIAQLLALVTRINRCVCVCHCRLFVCVSVLN